MNETAKKLLSEVDRSAQEEISKTVKKLSSDLESKVEQTIIKSSMRRELRQSRQDEPVVGQTDKPTFYFECRNYKVFIQPGYHGRALELEDNFN